MTFSNLSQNSGWDDRIGDQRLRNSSRKKLGATQRPPPHHRSPLGLGLEHDRVRRQRVRRGSPPRDRPSSFDRESLGRRRLVPHSGSLDHLCGLRLRGARIFWKHPGSLNLLKIVLLSKAEITRITKNWLIGNVKQPPSK